MGEKKEQERREEEMRIERRKKRGNKGERGRAIEVRGRKVFLCYLEKSSQRVLEKGKNFRFLVYRVWQ